MKTIAFHTLGCRLNQSETASIQNAFEAGGYQVVDAQESSDIVVINTCTVTEGGDADTRRLVHKINRLNPSARIALVGCQAQVQKEKLADWPNVRWVVGNGRKMDLLAVLNEHPSPDVAMVLAPAIDRLPFTQGASSIDHGHKRANIKIQDGCDFFCSFCEIPYARGRARSRVFDDIMREVGELAASGHKEIVLTGINIGTYAHEGRGLLDVIASMHRIEGLERIRISSIEPTTVPQELWGYMQTGKLCPYLHLPLQSGSNSVLEAMRRKYSREEFIDFIRQARSRVKGICIGTDIIVGFPEETDEDFEQTMALVREEPIDYVHVFSYSQRHMAKSRLNPVHVPSSIISRRSQLLRELSARKKRLFSESLVGTVQHLIIEGIKDGWGHGMTSNYVKVKFEASAGVAPNQSVFVKVSGFEGDQLWGRMLQ